MKRLFFCAIALLSLASFAQEGCITYAMEMPNLPPEAQAMVAGMETKTWFKGDLSRTEVTSPFSSQIVIANKKTGETVTLIDMMGQKYMIKEKDEDKEKDKNVKTDVKVKQLNDKKVIAGYNCQNAEVTMKVKGDDGKEKEVVAIVWYTKEIKFAANGYEGTFKGLGGVPMEYEMDRDGQKIKFTCKSYSQDAVADSRFDIPEGYTLTTREELMKMMGGMGK
ncbi:MAG: DUF4412 domain-containing protein [Bacteroidia bacterium]|nr:DUF4412 domain-containing protein [Bacteroidia bacterium]